MIDANGKPVISQREARRLRKRVAELEAERSRLHRRWLGDMPSWKAIGREEATPILVAKVKTARTLYHAVVVVPGADGTDLIYFACETGSR